MTEQTALQQIVDEEQAPEFLDDLRELDPEDEPWGITIQVHAEDLEPLRRELEEVTGDGRN